MMYVLLRESKEISQFWLYPTMQIEKSERSKLEIVASRKNGNFALAYFRFIGFHCCAEFAHTVLTFSINSNTASHCICYKIWSGSEVNTPIFLQAQYQESRIFEVGQFS